MDPGWRGAGPASKQPARRFRGSGWPGRPVERNPGAAERIPPDPRPETLRERLTGWLWLLGWELARRAPEPIAFGVADLAGRLAFHLSATSRRRVARSLARVLAAEPDDPQTVRATQQAFRSYARYWVEAFRAADLDAAEIDARISTEGVEHLDGALNEGRGVVVLLAHHGSWDIAAQWGETNGYHLAVVAEVLRPRRLFKRFVRLRETVGLEVVPLPRARTASSQQRAGAIIESLRRVTDANHIVGLLADRDLTRRGPIVDLFGEPAHIPRGPAVLSLHTAAPIVPATMLQRPGRRWHLRVLPPIDVQGLSVQEATARVARAVEDLIRLDPPQWHCFSPIWQADRRSGEGKGRSV